MSRVENALANNMCSGCGLCSAKPDKMVIAYDGFARPKEPIIDDLSEAGCPGAGLTQNSKEKYDSLWGPVVESFTGYSSSPEIRRMGSSGGVLTGILDYCLTQKLVDEVIQIGASIENPIRNQVNFVSQPESLLDNAGSRYSPSSPLSVIREIIGNGKKYAFIGKPCDVAALRSLTESNNKLKEQFPVLLSFMCAGVPSEFATKDILEEMDVSEKELIGFRYRGDGWPGLTTAVTKDGRKKTMTYNDSWGQVLNKKLQPRCKICVDGTGESSDITCADAWHESENGFPSFEEKDGRSLIITRTKFGNELLAKAIRDGAICSSGDFLLENLEKIQPFQANRKKTLLVRLLALKIFGAYTPSYTSYRIVKLSFSTSPTVQAKAFIGTVLRKIKGRI